MSNIIAFEIHTPERGDEYLFATEDQILAMGGDRAFEDQLATRCEWYQRLNPPDGSPVGMLDETGAVLVSAMQMRVERGYWETTQLGRLDPYLTAYEDGRDEARIYHCIYYALRRYLRSITEQFRYFELKDLSLPPSQIADILASLNAGSKAREDITAVVLDYDHNVLGDFDVQFTIEILSRERSSRGQLRPKVSIVNADEAKTGAGRRYQSVQVPRAVRAARIGDFRRFK